MKSFQSGNNISHGSYKSFEPNHINRSWLLDDMSIISLLSQADRQVGRLDMYSEYVNIEMYIRLHIAKEATQSSKIEGTQTNIEDAFLERQEIIPRNRDDWDEVQNYIKAMDEAIFKLHQLPFSSRLIRDTHKVLMQGVRGHYKLPGEFRSSQNWIGGTSISNAQFIPPFHENISDLMSDLEKFAHDEISGLPDLIKIAIIHYQFETIHPFLDGNGRVGRLIITLYLVSKGILKRPILYLSDFFERNRMLYYDNLTQVRTKNDISQWLKFFLTGVIETAKDGVRTFDSILQLQRKLEAQVKSLGSRSNDAIMVINYLYQQPIVDSLKVSEIINKTPRPAYRLVSDLERMGILKEITGGERGRLYLFESYVNLFK